MEDTLHNGKKLLTDIAKQLRNGEKLTLPAWFPTLTAGYCLVSMLLPWIHIGLKGSSYAVTLREVLGSSRQIPAFTFLSPVRAAYVLTFVRESDFPKLFPFVGILMWILCLVCAGVAVCHIRGTLNGKSCKRTGMGISYGILCAACVVITIITNHYAAEELYDPLFLSFTGAKSTSLFHIQLWPIVGAILLILDARSVYISGEGFDWNDWKDIIQIGRTCPRCGAAVTAGAKFCGSCGAVIPETKEAKNWVCECGKKNPMDSAFCPACGRKRPGGTAEFAYCAKCGKKIPAGKTICDDCAHSATGDHGGFTPPSDLD